MILNYLRKNHRTPRPMIVDAYTAGSEIHESKEALDKSVYYITFRKLLNKVNSDVYQEGDDRIVFYGLGKIIDWLLYDPVTYEEIALTKLSLEKAKANTVGLEDFYFPEKQWLRVVEEFNGRIPIKIKALKEGSVAYPNEPVIQVTCDVKGLGNLGAWFESTFLKVWSLTEMTTQCKHWYENRKRLIEEIYGNTITEEEKEFKASLRLHNFGCRAGAVPQESEWLGEAALLVFPGTDTFAGGYQAWENSNRTPGMFFSVDALAHRNVQSFETEDECFQNLFNVTGDNAIISNVADCYSFYDATERKLIPLALECKRIFENGGGFKVIVDRPDSGNALEQVTWACRTAHKFGLSEEITINGKTWRKATHFKVLEGDGMTFKDMIEIDNALVEQGFIPDSWLVYGVGGGLRKLSRDDFSAKYALCAVGENNSPRCKFSEEIGKTTLPGPFKLLRSEEALKNKKTIAFETEEGEDALVLYYDGTSPEVFGEGMLDNFLTIKDRIRREFNKMPKTLCTKQNNFTPATDLVREKRFELLEKYSPKKLKQNY